jgi:hypothetical protein
MEYVWRLTFQQSLTATDFFGSGNVRICSTEKIAMITSYNLAVSTGLLSAQATHSTRGPASVTTFIPPATNTHFSVPMYQTSAHAALASGSSGSSSNSWYWISYTTTVWLTGDAWRPYSTASDTGKESSTAQLSVSVPPSITIPPATLPSGYCYSSWKRVYSDLIPLWKQDGTRTITQAFVTVLRVGNTSLYTACDGIPRLRWNAPSNATTTSTFTVVRKIPGIYTIGTKEVKEYFWKDLDQSICRIEDEDQDSYWFRTQPCFPGDHKFCEELEKVWSPAIPEDKDDGKQTPELEFYDKWCWRRTSKEAAEDFQEAILKHLCYITLGVDMGYDFWPMKGWGVVLIHWPHTSQDDEFCPSNRSQTVAVQYRTGVQPVATVVTTAITFHGQDIYLDDHGTFHPQFKGHTTPLHRTSSIMYGNFTFTSPTIYLAHRTISVEEWTRNTNRVDARTRVVRTPGIVAIKAEHVSSVRPMHDKADPLDWPQHVARGEFNPQLFRPLNVPSVETVPFNFDNLADPVPANVFYDARVDCAGRQSHCATITDDTYRPQIILNDEFWTSFLPEWRDCHRPRIQDPPIALQITETINAPSINIARPGGILSQEVSSATRNVGNDARPIPSRPPHYPGHRENPQGHRLVGGSQSRGESRPDGRDEDDYRNRHKPKHNAGANEPIGDGEISSKEDAAALDVLSRIGSRTGMGPALFGYPAWTPDQQETDPRAHNHKDSRILIKTASHSDLGTSVHSTSSGHGTKPQEPLELHGEDRKIWQDGAGSGNEKGSFEGNKNSPKKNSGIANISFDLCILVVGCFVVGLTIM